MPYSKEYIPVSNLTPSQVTKLNSVEGWRNYNLLPFTIYFDMKDITPLENQVLSTGIPLTLEQASTLTIDNSAALSWLSQRGNVMWNDNFVAIFTPSVSFYEEIGEDKLYCNSFTIPSGTYANIFSLNEYISLPYGMRTNGLNYSASSTLPVSIITSEKKYDLLLAQLNVTPTLPNQNYLSIQEDADNVILLIEQELVSTGSLDYYAQWFSTKFGRTYESFSEKVHYVAVDENLNIVTIDLPITPATLDSFTFDFDNNTEAILDIVAVLTSNPSTEVYCFLGLIPGITYNADILRNVYYQDYSTLLTYYFSQTFVINTISSSYAVYFKVNPLEKNRVNQQSRLDSCFGISMFQASGDRGAYYEITGPEPIVFNLSEPDSISFSFSGSGAITVGGVIPNADQTTYGPMTSFFLGYSSSGGFQRGYPISEWKKKARDSYSEENSVSEVVNKNNNVSQIYSEVDFGGEIFPDLTFNSLTYMMDNITFPIGGTSLSTPLLASYISFINSQRSTPIAALHRIIYTDRFSECLSSSTKSVQRNSILSLLGYKPSIESIWDPVNGLGRPNTDKMVEILTQW